MDLSPQQVQEIQEIERQIDPHAKNGPQVISQQEVQDKSILLNILAALGITVAGTTAVILLMIVPFSKKKLATNTLPTKTSTIQVASEPVVVVETEYQNPFDAKTQYTNPFSTTSNPFANLTQ
jgi:hypothetical protein